MIKQCKYCGKSFETNRKNVVFCKGPHFNTCVHCGKTFQINNVHYPEQCCSIECRNAYAKHRREETNLKKYGVKNSGWTAESQEKIKQYNLDKYGTEWATQSAEFKEKTKQTCLERYGVENVQQNEQIRRKTAQTCLERYGDSYILGKNSSLRSKIIETNINRYGTADPGNLPEYREKAKQTCLKKYGTEWYTQTSEYKEKIKQTSLEKYGVAHFTQSDEVKQKQRTTMLERYGVSSPMQISEVKESLSTANQEKWGVPWPCMRPECLQAQGVQPSKLNRLIGDRLQELGLTISFEYHIKNKSYDIKIDDTNILVEIDPTYTHTCYPTKLGGRDKDYHKKKSKIASEAGYRCIHIFDWDDQDKILNFFKYRQRIYARNCIIEEVSEKQCNEFLTAYHLQNSCKGQEIRLGLYYNDDLIQLITFGSPRYNKNFEYELLRLCTKTEYNVIGGSQKLFKYFIVNFHPTSIVSYCDNAKFSGEVYSKLGFKLTDDGEPSIHWSKYNNHITDNLLRQRGYDQLFGTHFGKGTSNEQLMLENGWLPVADCGQSRYEWREQDK